MNTARALLAAVVIAWSPAQAVGGREDVLKVFCEYERLNAEFVRSVSAGTGISAKPYAQLRREVEAYAEGPFEAALHQAQQIICASKDHELLAALMRVSVATGNSANESPTEVLRAVAKCQPNQFRAVASQLRTHQRADIARRAPELKAAFKQAPQ